SLPTRRSSDLVKLSIGTEGKIEILDITSRGADKSTPENMIEGKVYSIDTYAETLILELDQNGQKTYHPYEFSSTYDLYINGKWSSYLDDIKKDMRAKVQLFDDKIVYVEVDNRLNGKVVRVDKDRRILTLALSNGQQVPYYVSSDYDVTIRHESRASLSDLEQQDEVRVKLDDSDRIIDIAVEREYAYLVKDVYESSKRLYVENEKGNGYNLNIDTNIELSIPGKTSPKVTDFSKGDIVKAKYLGDDLESIALLPSDAGMITNINQDKQEFTVAKNDGTTETYSFKSGDVVEYRSNEYTQLNNLSV